jgi:ABC-type cobalamin transport system ATPase subunit
MPAALQISLITTSLTCHQKVSSHQPPADVLRCAVLACLRGCLCWAQFVSDVMKPMTIDPLMDLEVQNLSGGELQRVALALCLGQPADIYLIDEPSAYLDSEQRIMASKVRRDAGIWGLNRRVSSNILRHPVPALLLVGCVHIRSTAGLPCLSCAAVLAHAVVML